MNQHDPTTERTGLRRVLWFGALGVAVLGIGIWIWVVIANASAPPTDSASVTKPSTLPSSSASPTQPVSSSAPTPNAPPDVLPELAPVRPEEVVKTADGLSVSVTKMEAIDGVAAAPGEISGPAVRFTIDIANDRTEPFDLGYTVVNGYTGDDRTPARSFIRGGSAPFSGSIAPGEKTTGVYIFAVPEDQRDNATLTVDYGAGIPAVVFQGRVP